MKRTVFSLFLLLSFLALPLHAFRITSVEDVIQMHRAGASAEVIVAALERPHERIEVTPEDQMAMREAGVPERVIAALVADSEREAGAQLQSDSLTTDPPSSGEEPEASTGSSWCLTFEPPLVLLYPIYYEYAAWLWDPYWYMPRLDGRVAAHAPTGTAVKTKGGSIERQRGEGARGREVPVSTEIRPRQQGAGSEQRRGIGW